jgi:zinc-ribbon domain
MPLERCSDCGTEVSATAKSCPKCGRDFYGLKPHEAVARRLALIVFAVLAVLVFIYMFNNYQQTGHFMR